MGERRAVIRPRPWSAHSSSILKALAVLARTAFDDDDDRGEVMRACAVAGRSGLDAIEALLRERQWQPIETAPRDGRELLVWNPSFYQGRGGWAVALWHRDAWRMPISMTALTPTHWMPLPAGPEVDNEP